MLRRPKRREAPDDPGIPKEGRESGAAPPKLPARAGVDRRFARHHWRLGRLLLGPAAMPKKWQGMVYDADTADGMLDQVRIDRAFAEFADRIARGADHESAHVATIKALLRAGQVVAARAYGLGLAGLPNGERLTQLGLALCLEKMGRRTFVWDRLRGLEPSFLARHAPVVAVHAALLDGNAEAGEAARAIVADPSIIDTDALPQLAGRFLVAGDTDTARRLHGVAGARDDLSDKLVHQQENLARWLAAPAPVPDLPAGRIRLGLFDYYHPELVRAAGNVGDHVQTLALLGNLARFQGLTLHGAEGLGEVAAGLQSRVRPELRLEGPSAEVELLPVSRDYSEGDAIPEDTWIVAFGWHMHALYKLRFGLPYHRNLNPIFVAFHLNRTHALTPEAVDYLRSHGPIGCRDWTTVHLLLSAGVDAFFTGCLTSTVNAVFPPREDVEQDGSTVVAAIDVPAGSVKAKRPVEEVTHAVKVWHRTGLAEGLRNADELLCTYLRRYHRIVTSRLHSYLPATSLGVPVTFKPDVPGDVRFAGLTGMTPDGEEFIAMRDGIRALLAEAFGVLLSGASRDEFYTRWRELTADQVAGARARFAAPPQDVDTGFDLEATVDAVTARTHRIGPRDRVDPTGVTNVAVSLDANYRGLLPVTLESIVANASGPLRVFVTARGLEATYRDWLSAAFPEVAFTFLDHDDVDHGTVHRMMGHVSVATMDRLLLPAVLPDVDRITYIDIDTVTLGDVCALAGTDLGGHPLAARAEPYSAAQTWRSIGDHLQPDEALELRRTMSAAHDFDFQTFNAGVLVLDLERMRRDHFVERFVPMARRFGLHDQDTLNAYAGPGRAELDPVWNAFPVRETVDEPRIVHYAGAGKPWQDRLVPSGELWRDYSERFTARAGSPPT